MRLVIVSAHIVTPHYKSSLASRMTCSGSLQFAHLQQNVTSNNSQIPAESCAQDAHTPTAEFDPRHKQVSGFSTKGETDTFIPRP